MSKSPYPLKLPAAIIKAGAELGASDGVSRNHFTVASVAEQVGSLRVARKLLREPAGSAQSEHMLKSLRRVPRAPPRTINSDAFRGSAFRRINPMCSATSCGSGVRMRRCRRASQCPPPAGPEHVRQSSMGIR